jgi:hypothetical protein
MAGPPNKPLQRSIGQLVIVVLVPAFATACSGTVEETPNPNPPPEPTCENFGRHVGRVCGDEIFGIFRGGFCVGWNYTEREIECRLQSTTCDDILGDRCTDPTLGAACETDEHCFPPLACDPADGVCVPCMEDSDCPPELVCERTRHEGNLVTLNNHCASASP